MATRRKYSPLWTHFEATAPKKAKCNYCSREIAISMSSIGSLGRHLKKVHPTVNIKNVMEDTFTANSDSEESITLHPDSELWGFFDKEPSSKAKCSMCGVIVSRDADTLYRHLKERHSNISENLEFKDNEENYTEIIYLENTEIEDKQSNKKEKGEAKILSEVQSTTKPYKRRYSLKEKSKCSETVKDGEIEDFGKYITGLLKGVPKEDCSKLQMEIVNLIMTVKIKAMEENTTDTDKDKTIEEKDENIDQSEQYESNCTQDPITGEAKLEIKKQNIDINKTEKATNIHTLCDNIHRHSDPEKQITAEKEEKNVDNFGKYVTSLLKCVHKEASAKLQMEIVDLITVTRLNFLQKPKSLTINGVLELQHKDSSGEISM